MKLHRRHCRQWFVPDSRNAWHQQYCSDPECRKTSRAASQRWWRRRIPDYFRGPEHRERIRDWRARHPFHYWRQTPVATGMLDVYHDTSRWTPSSTTSSCILVAAKPLAKTDSRPEGNPSSDTPREKDEEERGNDSGDDSGKSRPKV